MYKIDDLIAIQNLFISLDQSNFDKVLNQFNESSFKDLEYCENILSNIFMAANARPMQIHLYCDLVFRIMEKNEEIKGTFKSLLLPYFNIWMAKSNAYLFFIHFLYEKGVFTEREIYDSYKLFGERFPVNYREKSTMFCFFAKPIMNIEPDFYEKMIETDYKDPKKNKRILNFIRPLFLQIPDLISSKINYSKYLQYFFTDSNIIRESIKQDNVEELIENTSMVNFDYEILIEPSWIETSPFLTDVQSTMIQLAAFYGSIKCFKYLWLKKYKKNKLDTKNRDLHCYAVAGGNTEIIHLVFSGNKTKISDLTYLSLINIAISFFQNDVAIWLYEHIDSSISEKDKAKILYQCGNSNNLELYQFFVTNFNMKVIHGFFTSGCIFSVKLFFDDSDKELLLTRDAIGMLPTHYAAKYDHLYILKLFIRKYPELLNMQDNEGLSSFHLACFYSNIDVMKWLMTFPNLDINQTPKIPLVVAIENYHTEVIKILMNDPRIDLKAVCALGSVLDYSIINRRPDYLKMFMDTGKFEDFRTCAVKDKLISNANVTSHKETINAAYAFKLKSDFF